MLINMKNFKTFYEVQTASHPKEIIQPPHQPPPPPPPTSSNQIKTYYVFGTKILLQRYTELYRYFLSKRLKSEVLGRHEMMQRKCFF